MKTQKLYIAGHTGLVGSALVRHFSKMPAFQLITATHTELDLTRQKEVEAFFAATEPDVVILSAGRVGGIEANSKLPAQFIYDNMMMEANVIHAAYRAGVTRLINFGSACMYPKGCDTAMTPDLLMTGKIESTNEPYALAKLAGMSLVESHNRQYQTAYMNVIPSNLYGPGDSFDLERCHVVAALIRKFHEAHKAKAPEVVLWGTGAAKRDFLYVDDLAGACEVLLEKYHQSGPINVGAEAPCSVAELALAIARMVGYAGRVCWDSQRPDGAPLRFLDSSAMKALGWSAKVDLTTGLRRTYDWFLNKESA